VYDEKKKDASVLLSQERGSFSSGLSGSGIYRGDVAQYRNDFAPFAGTAKTMLPLSGTMAGSRLVEMLGFILY
jgi:hypothetical protein